MHPTWHPRGHHHLSVQLDRSNYGLGRLATRHSTVPRRRICARGARCLQLTEVWRARPCSSPARSPGSAHPASSAPGPRYPQRPVRLPGVWEQ